MQTRCEGEVCTTQGAGCSVTSQGSGCCPVSGQNACSVCGDSGKGMFADPFANAPEVWFQDIGAAIREVKLGILKAKVQKEIGPQLEKAANEAWEAGGAMWQAVLAQSQAALAKEGLRETLRRIFSEKGK